MTENGIVVFYIKIGFYRKNQSDLLCVLALNTEGIFRVAGTPAEVNKMAELLMEGKADSVDITSAITDNHAAASTTKSLIFNQMV